MYLETRGKNLIKQLHRKAKIRLNAEKFYQQNQYLSVIFCAMSHNELSDVVSNVRNVYSLLLKWKIPLSKDTIIWGFEILDAMNYIKWED